GWPTGASSGSSSRPEASASMPNSFAEQSMPNDSTPRSLAALIETSPGNCAPTVASGTLMPTRAFGAPQTICSGSPCPASTLHTCSRSACGCFSAATISATTTPARPSPSGVSSSTSSPAMVSACANAARSALTSTSSRNQFSENFMVWIREWGIGNREWERQKPRHRGRLYDSLLPIPDSRSCKLPEKPQIVLEERTQVGDAVAQHGEALHAEAEGEAGVALRIDAAVLQHVRMHHAAAEHLQPAALAILGLPADVDLGRRLGKGEIAGAETHLEIAFEERADELGQGALEVGETGSLVNQQPFDLMEHRRVSLVRIA